MSALLRLRKFTSSTLSALGAFGEHLNYTRKLTNKSHLDSPFGGKRMAEKNIKKSSGKTAPAKTLKEKRADKKDKATAKANYKEA